MITANSTKNMWSVQPCQTKSLFIYHFSMTAQATLATYLVKVTPSCFPIMLRGQFACQGKVQSHLRLVQKAVFPSLGLANTHLSDVPLLICIIRQIAMPAFLDGGHWFERLDLLLVIPNSSRIVPRYTLCGNERWKRQVYTLRCPMSQLWTRIVEASLPESVHAFLWRIQELWEEGFVPLLQMTLHRLKNRMTICQNQQVFEVRSLTSLSLPPSPLFHHFPC